MRNGPKRNRPHRLRRESTLPLFLCMGCLLSVAAQPAAAQSSEMVLPGTSPLKLSTPLDVFMVDGINQHSLRAIANSPTQRAEKWQPDYTSPAAYVASVESNRTRFRRIIGATDPRVTVKRGRRLDFELLSTLHRSSVVARTDDVTVHVVRWQVLDGVTQEGLLLKPATIRACVVAIPDADWTAEMFCGLTGDLPVQAQLARRLAATGCLVVVPTLISRSDDLSGSPHVGYTNLTHREFLYRQAFEAGRHIIGYEVQKVLAAVDLVERLNHSVDGADPSGPTATQRSLPIGVAGVGEGALLALYAAALDRRITSTLVCGYFQQREDVWKEPIYRNVWGLLSEFGDAELAGLIAPRRLVIEACRAVESSGPPAVRTGRRQAAAPGQIARIPLASVRTEFARGAKVFLRLQQQHQLVLAVSGRTGNGTPGTSQAMSAFSAGLAVPATFDIKPPVWRMASGLATDPHKPGRTSYETIDRERQRRQFVEIQDHIQGLLRRSPKVRNALWKTDLRSVANWLPVRERLQGVVHDTVIGRLPSNNMPLRTRTRRVLDTPDYSGYEVVLDVLPDVVAGGILLLPKNLKANEKRPVVVCQHGLEGTPMDTISRKPEAFRYYKAFSHQLCRQGFIVYAPQNPYRGGDRFRSIQRKSNPLKRSLFSYIIAQHRQTLDWLATLPQVDAERIAFYGLSYGGKTAMRVPPFIDRYCLSICSGDFTDWIRTITTTDYRYGYIFTGEYEIPEWNMAHVASYAELAMLMSPRPFMVEQGHRDGGTPSEWVAGEFGKVRRHYDVLKLGNRAEIEFFDGPHTINGRGTFEFLHRHLKFPEPEKTP